MASEQLLIDMGFPKEQVEKAIKACGDSTEQAMEWLLAHASDTSTGTAVNSNIGTEQSTIVIPNESEPEPMEIGSTENIAVNESSDTVNESSATVNESCATVDAAAAVNESVTTVDGTPETAENIDVKDDQAKSYKCDECQKLFKNSDEVEFHAVKSGHSSFSESKEEKKPLSDEEKKEKLKFLEDRMRQRRLEKEQEDRQENINREKKRIQQGKDISETKQRMLEKEVKLLAEERRRDKLEDKMARQRVKDQIERDKLARREMFGGASAKPEGPSTPVVVTPAVVVPKKTYNTTRLQIRLPVGKPLVQEFDAKESLSAVRLWVKLNRTDCSDITQVPFTLSTTFPRKIFTEDDMNQSLQALGLTPSSVLVVNDVKVPVLQ